MIKKSKPIIVVAVLMFVVIILQTVFIRNIRNKYNACSYEINKQINVNRQSEGQKSIILSSYKKTYLYNGVKLNNVQVQGEPEENIRLNSILNGKTKIIYYFDQHSCVKCVNDDLYLFNNFVELIGNENALILANFADYKEFYQFLCRNDIKCKVFNIAGSNLGIEVENMSAIFVVGEDLIVNKFFIPHNSLNDITKEFLNDIKYCYYKF